MSHKKDISAVHDEDTTLPRNVGIRSSISAALSSLTSLQAFKNSRRLDMLLYVIIDVTHQTYKYFSVLHFLLIIVLSP